MCERGLGTVKDSQEALRWYEKAMEQDCTGDSHARAALLCSSDSSIPDFFRKACEYAVRAAELGSSEGQYILGRMFALGVCFPRDSRQALRWILEAATQDHERAIVNAIFFFGWGLEDLPPDLSQAVTWAMRGLELGLPMVKYVLSVMYRTGVGVELDSGRAELLELELGPGNMRRGKEYWDCVLQEHRLPTDGGGQDEVLDF